MPTEEEERRVLFVPLYFFGGVGLVVSIILLVISTAGEEVPRFVVLGPLMFFGGFGLFITSCALIFSGRCLLLIRQEWYACSLNCVHSDPERPLLDADDAEAGNDPHHEIPEVMPGTKCPSYWKNQNLDEDFDERVNVSPHVKQQIEELLQSTFRSKSTRDRKGTPPSRLRLVKVMRIEDRRMWVLYENEKRRLFGQRMGVFGDIPTDVKTGSVLQDRLDEAAHEYYLWHGSSPEGVQAISEDGFLISRAGSNAGTMFGRGVYFAECSSKADEYAQEGTNLYAGIYGMVLSRVLCGNMYYTDHSNVPEIESEMRSGEYDSVLGDRESAVGTYREFVVFKERQIYPEYTVLYEREYDGTPPTSDDNSSEEDG